jgi:hypothetical protein
MHASRFVIVHYAMSKCTRQLYLSLQYFTFTNREYSQKLKETILFATADTPQKSCLDICAETLAFHAVNLLFDNSNVRILKAF